MNNKFEIKLFLNISNINKYQFYLYMSINLICGPMYSGKTSELCRRYNRYKLAGKKCILVKYQKDDRYNKNKISTHDNEEPR